MKSWRMCALLLLAVVSLSHRIDAHPSPHSGIELDVKETAIDAFLHVPLPELELAIRKPLVASPKASLALHKDELLAYIAQHIQVRSPDGSIWTLTIDPDLSVTEGEVKDDLMANLHLVPPAGQTPRIFVLESDLVQHQVINHKIFVTLRSDWPTGVFAEQAKLLSVLQFMQNSVRINLSQGSIWQGFTGTFRLGLKHIAEGTDHLLFLLMLMLPAALIARRGRWGSFRGFKASFMQLIKIVTAFTIGHSLTLAIGGLHWFQPQTWLVESLIAVSIFVSAIHALKPLFPNRESWIAAGFGLIHGLAFSATIAEFNLGTKELLLSILGFNLGIEAMQLAIVGVVVPWLLILANVGWYKWIRIPLAAFGGLAALGWLGERALGLVNPMAPAVDFVVQHVLIFTLVLGGIAILQLIVTRVFLQPRHLL